VTRIDRKTLVALENGSLKPIGDQILIFADFYQCDYNFFISSEKLAPFEQTETLYRRYGAEFHKDDRRRVQEFLYLCECEESLAQTLGRQRGTIPKVQKTGDYFKGHGERAAIELRRHLGYKANEIPMNVYSDFRQLGCHILRRELATRIFRASSSGTLSRQAAC